MSSSPFSFVSPRSLDTSPDPHQQVVDDAELWNRLAGLTAGHPSKPHKPARVATVGEEKPDAAGPLERSSSSDGFSLEDALLGGAYTHRTPHFVPEQRGSSSRRVRNSSREHRPASFTSMFKPPSVMDLMGPPPSLPALSANHVLAPLVEQLRAWVTESLELHESRDKHRAEIMQQCISSAHSQAVAAAKRARAEVHTLEAQLQACESARKQADADAASLRSSLRASEATLPSSIARAVAEREQLVRAELNRRIEELQAQVRWLSHDSDVFS